MYEDKFFRYIYFPESNERIPFRLYQTLNQGFIGDFVGLELLSERFLIEGLPKGAIDRLRRHGIHVIGSRNLLMTVKVYEKCRTKEEEVWGEYNDLRIYTIPHDILKHHFRDQLSEEFYKLHEAFSDFLGEELFDVSSSFSQLLELTISFTMNVDEAYERHVVRNLFLETLSGYFDVIYHKSGLLSISYLLIVSNYIRYDNFKYKVICNFSRVVKENIASNSDFGIRLLKFCERYINEWETA